MQHRMDYMKDILINLKTCTGSKEDLAEATPNDPGSEWRELETIWNLTQAHAKNQPSKLRQKLEKNIAVQRAAAATNPHYAPFARASTML